MTPAQKSSAELIESIGRKRGHDLSSWHAADLVLDAPPPPNVHVIEGPKLGIACANCDAWAMLIDADVGAVVSSANYDDPCPGPEKASAA